ncbi:hypothetical protein H6G35_34385 [Aulosira sp. FACHB-113]|nr:hypothetical protein [Aulosira sp. FACHB-113]
MQSIYKRDRVSFAMPFFHKHWCIGYGNSQLGSHSQSIDEFGSVVQF